MYVVIQSFHGVCRGAFQVNFRLSEYSWGKAPGLYEDSTMSEDKKALKREATVQLQPRHVTSKHVSEAWTSVEPSVLGPIKRFCMFRRSYSVNVRQIRSCPQVNLNRDGGVPFKLRSDQCLEVFFSLMRGLPEAAASRILRQRPSNLPLLQVIMMRRQRDEC